MTNIIHVISLIVGFVLLVKGADLFVDGASRLAMRLGVPAVVVGLTVVALGTSAPEAAISISAALQQTDGMTIANVLGSNIINTLVILGVTALVTRVPVDRTLRSRGMPLALAATLLALGMCLHDGELGRLDAAVLLGLLAGYLWWMVGMARGQDLEAGRATCPDGDVGTVRASSATASRDGSSVADAAVQTPLWGLLALCAAGALGIAAGAHLAVGGASGIAQLLGMSERVVGLTVVALGTSLPELVTSVTAARKGQADLAVGNVVGSGMLNVLFVLGVAGAISPVAFASELLVDGLVAAGAVTLLWLLSVRRQRLGKAEGVVLLGSYTAYLGWTLGA